MYNIRLYTVYTDYRDRIPLKSYAYITLPYTLQQLHRP